MVITNGFTYIAFLMCLAGVLLALEKYTKWKIFNLVPPLVWIYVLNMIFCTMGLYHSKEVSAAYKALKNNLLYAMIFVMLLRCDFRKLAKLGGRMVAIFLGCSVTLFIGFVIGYPIFKGFLGHDTWGAVAALYASWVGGFRTHRGFGLQRILRRHRGPDGGPGGSRREFRRTDLRIYFENDGVTGIMRGRHGGAALSLFLSTVNGPLTVDGAVAQCNSPLIQPKGAQEHGQTDPLHHRGSPDQYGQCHHQDLRRVLHGV